MIDELSNNLKAIAFLQAIKNTKYDYTHNVTAKQWADKF